MKLTDKTYRTVVDDLLEFVVRWKPDWTRTFANKAYCNYFGFTVEEAIGKSFMPLVSKEHRQRITDKISRLTPENPFEIDEHEVIRPDGSIGWNEWLDRGIFDNEGKLIEIQSVGRDITDRKTIEAALKESEGRFRTFSEASFEGIVITEKGKFVDANNRFLKLLGRTLDEIKGEEVTNIVIQSDRELVKSKIMSEDDKPYETHIIHKDGSKLNVEVCGKSIQSNGKTFRITAISDITERKNTQKELVKKMEELLNHYKISGMNYKIEEITEEIKHLKNKLS